MQLLTTTTHSEPVNKGRVENLYPAKTVVRKRYGGNRRRCSSTVFLGSDRNRNGWTQKLLTKCEQPVGHSDNGKQPVDKSCSGSATRTFWTKSSVGGTDDEDEIDRRSTTVSSGEAHVVSNDHHTVADINGYHPVRRRVLVTSKSDEETTTELDDGSLSKHYNLLHSELYWPFQWFSNLCRPKPSLFITAASDRHPQNHHHRILHRHRSNHHHTHHLHMWTSSCCWWLLVLYAAIVVVASFARAAHSAKDGKYTRYHS